MIIMSFLYLKFFNDFPLSLREKKFILKRSIRLLSNFSSLLFSQHYAQIMRTICTVAMRADLLKEGRELPSQGKVTQDSLSQFKLCILYLSSKAFRVYFIILSTHLSLPTVNSKRVETKYSFSCNLVHSTLREIYYVLSK